MYKIFAMDIFDSRDLESTKAKKGKNREKRFREIILMP